MNVVIAGAGVAGLGIGWRLRQTGVDVTVLDRAQPGRGATWASAGMIAPDSERDGANSPEAQFANHSSGLWPAFAAELEEESGVPVRYRKSGSLICSTQPPSSADLDGNKARAMEPMLSPIIRSARWLPDEAQVDNRALGRALADAFMDAGGVLVANEAVVRIETDGARVLGVRTPINLYQADAYILAAGAWTARIEGLPDGVMPPVAPVKGEMISLVPPSGAAMPTHMVRSHHAYLVPRETRLFVGATMADAGFDTATTLEAEQFLFDEAVALMPPLEDWPIDEHWAGLRPGSPDGLPILGATALDGLFAATGQFRNGILFAPAVAEALCALVLGREPGMDVRAFDPRRFAR
jgi:glycine oxidase